MNHMQFLKRSPLFIFFIGACASVFSQTCEVDLQAIQGVYEGDCRKGKANGFGKSVGKDTYEGKFKAGLPDGDGVYTWSNGNSYTGHFSQGIKDGTGTMTYKSTRKQDSVVVGFWKKDAYVSRYERIYKVNFRSRKVSSVRIRHDVKGPHQITIRISSTGTGAATMQGRLPKVEITNLILIKGNYLNTFKNDSYSNKSEVTLLNASFPFGTQMIMGTETVEFELFEEGAYVVEININQ
jgi:hypothetical protein